MSGPITSGGGGAAFGTGAVVLAAAITPSALASGTTNNYAPAGLATCTSTNRILSGFTTAGQFSVITLRYTARAGGSRWMQF